MSVLGQAGKTRTVRHVQRNITHVLSLQRLFMHATCCSALLVTPAVGVWLVGLSLWSSSSVASRCSSAPTDMSTPNAPGDLHLLALQEGVPMAGEAADSTDFLVAARFFYSTEITFARTTINKNSLSQLMADSWLRTAANLNSHKYCILQRRYRRALPALPSLCSILPTRDYASRPMEAVVWAYSESRRRMATVLALAFEEMAITVHALDTAHCGCNPPVRWDPVVMSQR